MANETTQIRDLRRLRAHPWVWAVVFVVLAGPLNPAAWALARPAEGNIIVDDYSAFIWIILMPATVLAVTLQYGMEQRQSFTAGNMWIYAMVGLLLGMLSGPLGFCIWVMMSEGAALSELPSLLIVSYVFGTLLGIIPMYATVFGIPCMIVAVGIAYLCTQPVKTLPLPARNTTLPKRQKPV